MKSYTHDYEQVSALIIGVTNTGVYYAIKSISFFNDPFYDHPYFSINKKT